MPFGFTSAPSSSQRLLNHILKPHRNPFGLAYLDDVLIYSNDLEEHLEHVATVLTLLNDNSTRLRLSKFFFANNELEYLGHMVSREGLSLHTQRSNMVLNGPHLSQLLRMSNNG